ncbi:MAG: DUF1284 domain-containing protein [Nitrospirae bacterium]|nr:DUF1284 domain-containing protein [Nitrospirota bacterium]
MIKLRGHHLICLHFFHGEGYNSKFVENLRLIIKSAETGEKIEICTEADDVCRICPYMKDNMCFYNKDAEPEIIEMDRKAVKLLGFRIKEQVKWIDIKEKIPEIFKEWWKEYCKKCDWRWACEYEENFIRLINEKTENKF